MKTGTLLDLPPGQPSIDLSKQDLGRSDFSSSSLSDKRAADQSFAASTPPTQNNHGNPVPPRSFWREGGAGSAPVVGGAGDPPRRDRSGKPELTKAPDERE